jgi:hypothetical protein
VSRSRRPRRRGYQPLPERRNPWLARFLVIAIGVLLIFGTVALFAGTR